MTGPTEEVDDGRRDAAILMLLLPRLPDRWRVVVEPGLHFWRLELDPLLLVVHRLAGSAYEITGSYDDQVQLDEPVQVSFRLATLLG